MNYTRREFNRLSALAGIGCFGGMNQNTDGVERVDVAIVVTTDREAGILRAVKLLGDLDFSAKDVYLKCNYNSPHPFPATTHPESLTAAVKFLKAKGSRRITLAERSGMGLTRDVVTKLGVLKQIEQLEIAFMPLEELAADKWRQLVLPDSHWKNGIEVPHFLSNETCVVQVCNLKTHRFGGEFSAALKNSIGLIPKYSPTNPPRNYMEELHASPHQCQMIAEVNQVYSPRLIIMDAVQSFINGGPESGEVANPGIIAVSRDRVAVDAIGLAILRNSGAGFPLDRGSIFDQAQIKRSVELELGVRSAEQIHLITDDAESRALADRLTDHLNNSPIF